MDRGSFNFDKVKIKLVNKYGGVPIPDCFWDVLILPMQTSFISYPGNSVMACLWVTAIDIVIAKQFTGKNNELLYCRFKAIGFSRKMYIQASFINMKLDGYCSCGPSPVHCHFESSIIIEPGLLVKFESTKQDPILTYSRS